MNIEAAYLEEARRSLRGHKRLAEGAFAQLSDEEFFRVPNYRPSASEPAPGAPADAESNSVAIVAKHIAGNLRSRFADFLTSDGEKPDRHRDQEFEMTPNTQRDEVMGWWENGWKLLFDALSSLKPEDLGRTVTIRGEPHTVLQAIHRATAHMAYHTGQIVFLAKHWKGANWKSLSIPRGKSEEFNARKLADEARKPPEKQKPDPLERLKFP